MLLVMVLSTVVKPPRTKLRRFAAAEHKNATCQLFNALSQTDIGVLSLTQIEHESMNFLKLWLLTDNHRTNYDTTVLKSSTLRGAIELDLGWEPGSGQAWSFVLCIWFLLSNESIRISLFQPWDVMRAPSIESVTQTCSCLWICSMIIHDLGCACASLKLAGQRFIGPGFAGLVVQCPFVLPESSWQLRPGGKTLDIDQHLKEFKS